MSDFDFEAEVAWSRDMFDRLNEGAIWTVPRCGLVFQRRGETLVLVARESWEEALHRPVEGEEEARIRDEVLGQMGDRAAGFWASFQEEDYEAIRRRFEAAGVAVHRQGGEAMGPYGTNEG